MKNIKIYIATHKKAMMPNSTLYEPIFVGSNGKNSIENYQRDDLGDNISYKNPNYCELTALYWAWKNSTADYIGLVHYRRYFGKKKFFDGNLNTNVFQEDYFSSILNRNTIIVPKKRKYYIETLYSHYAHTHYSEDLNKVKKIISDKHPDYLQSFDSVMKQTSGYMFNMFVMPKEYLNDYCLWLFDILEKLEEEIDLSNYDSFQARVFGRISELLFNVWLVEHKKEFELKEINWIYTEKINYVRKTYSFLVSKFFQKKFKKSF